MTRHAIAHMARGLPRTAESIGRPLGNDRFLASIERLTGLALKPGKRGPKPSDAETSSIKAVR